MTSTTPYPFVYPTHADDNVIYHPIDLTNKAVYLGWAGLFIALGLLLNVAVMAVVVYVYVTRRALADRSPHFIPMLACCAALILNGVWDCVLFNELRQLGYRKPLILTCHETLALELSGFMVSVLPVLLVAAVLLAHAVRLQTVLVLSACRLKAVGALLVLMCLCYVAVVTVPVFFTALLEEPQHVCEGGSSGTEYLNYQTDKNKYRVVPAFHYIVPSLLVLVACVVLLLARFVLNRTTPISAATTTTTTTSTSTTTTSPTFPVNAVLAGLSCIALRLPTFLRMFEQGEWGWEVETLLRLWLAGGILEKINGVFLPILWLLDADIRALWCRCRNASRASSDEVILQSVGDEGQDNDGHNMNSTGV